MRVTNSIYLLSGAGYGRIGNVYAILAEEKVFMIDTGQDKGALDLILENMHYYGLDRYPVTDVLITHMHKDHTGNAWYFQNKGAKIHISEQDASGMETGGIRVNEYGIKPYYTCKADDKLQDGQKLVINGVEIETFLMPGHTNGSMLYRFEIDGKSVICTGDFVNPIPGEFDNGFNPSFGWLGSSEMDKTKYLNSLERALTIQADILLGGHGIPVMVDGDHLIKKGFKLAMTELRW